MDINDIAQPFSNTHRFADVGYWFEQYIQHFVQNDEDVLVEATHLTSHQYLFRVRRADPYPHLAINDKACTDDNLNKAPNIYTRQNSSNSWLRLERSSNYHYFRINSIPGLPKIFVITEILAQRPTDCMEAVAVFYEMDRFEKEERWGDEERLVKQARNTADFLRQYTNIESSVEKQMSARTPFERIVEVVHRLHLLSHLHLQRTRHIRLNLDTRVSERVS